jgi:hypothetical protein
VAPVFVWSDPSGGGQFLAGSPDCRTNEAVFGGSDSLGWIVIAIVALIADARAGAARWSKGPPHWVDRRAPAIVQFSDFALEVAATLR